ncbi:MAG: IS110 family transposase [Planctomycetes bacterium]|nr:IS110 family transposase [Planctomycetota bacterium]
MKYYCGIDLHASNSVLCVIDETERIHLRKKVPNCIFTITEMLNGFSPRPEVVIEATLNWYWLVDWLQEDGFNVKLAHTFGLHMITGAKVKTDDRDAFTLAKLLRIKAIPESYIYPSEKRPIRDLLRRRSAYVSLRAEAYTAIRTRLLQNGLHGLSLATIKGLDEREIREMVTHPVIQASMLHELERIRLYSREIAKMEKMVLDFASAEPLFKLLQTIPGVGKILALTIYYETGEIERFGSAKQYCSNARVVPGVAQSGAVTRRGRGSKQGNPYLKWAFMQAASISVRYYPKVREFREKHMARRRSKAKRLISMSIVAHKLAIGAYHVMKRKVPFREELMFAGS